VDKVRFHFDPICPWCYQTSRWAKRLEELGEISLDWGLFSLEVVNLKEGEDPREIETRSGPALRTATLLRRREGSAAIGPFYTSTTPWSSGHAASGCPRSSSTEAPGRPSSDR
jgi:hypothetical protein